MIVIIIIFIGVIMIQMIILIKMRMMIVAGCDEMEDSTISSLILLTAGLILSGVRGTSSRNLII
jgi:hypothetical protein